MIVRNLGLADPKTDRIFRSVLFFGVLRRNHRVDIAAHAEISHHLDIPRFQKSDEIVQYAVGDVLMENFGVTKAVYIELQGFQFDTPLVRHVFDADGGEIGET